MLKVPLEFLGTSLTTQIWHKVGVCTWLGHDLGLHIYQGADRGGGGRLPAQATIMCVWTVPP